MLLSLALAVLAPQRSPEWTVQRQLAPLALSMPELREDLASMIRRVGVVNSSPPERDRIRIELGSGDDRVVLESLEALDTLPALPSAVTEMSITYLCPDCQVSSFGLSCADYGRTLTVSGQDHALVEDLVASLANRLDSHAAYYRGRTARFALYWLAFFVLVVVFHVRLNIHAPRWSVALGPILYAGLLVLTASTLLPTDQWLAGFFLTRDPWSWHGIIVYWGTVVAFLGTPLLFIGRSWPRIRAIWNLPSVAATAATEDSGRSPRPGGRVKRR
jgi:hypothetical protein